MDYFGDMPMDEDIPAFERLDCSNCRKGFNYSRDNVFVCGGKHPLCSACFTQTGDGDVPQPCKYLSHGCTFWDADEAELAEHQGECPQRPVGCIFECEAEAAEVKAKAGPKKAEVKAKDYVRHLREGHGLARDGSWTLWNDRSALRLWAQDGVHFLAVLTGNDRNCWQAWVETAAAAPRLAKKYRSAMRLSSEAGGSAFGTFEGPVWSMEDGNINNLNINKTDILFISSAEFECHNGGRERLGDHNRTEDGRVELPMSVKVERVVPLEEGEVED